MYLIQASPMTKIFIPKYQAECLENPKSMFDGKPFDVVVKRACGNVVLTHGKPVHCSTLLPLNKNRLLEDDEVTPLYDWLTDERNNETHMYGIVGIKIEADVSTAIMALVADGKGNKSAQNLIKDLQKNLTGSIADARARADERVRRHCKDMYNTVKETWDFMQKQGQGVYSPSYSESLSMEILKEEILQRNAPNKISQEKFKQTMTELQQQVQ